MRLLEGGDLEAEVLQVTRHFDQLTEVKGDRVGPVRCQALVGLEGQGEVIAGNARCPSRRDPDSKSSWRRGGRAVQPVSVLLRCAPGWARARRYAPR